MDSEDRARRLTELYGARAMHCLRAMLGNADDAEELWVNTFEICARKTLALRDPNNEQAYVMKVAKNLALRRMSRAKTERRQQSLASELAAGKWDSISSSRAGPEAIEDVEHLAYLLNRLDWKWRYVIVSTYVVCDSDAVIARALKMRESSVRAIRTRALAQLRQYCSVAPLEKVGSP